jgi:hypothetical protein
MSQNNALSSEVIGKALMAGSCLFVGEWRGAKPETVKYVSKKTGQPAQFGKLTHVVETGEGATFASVDVTEMVPDGVDPAAHPVPFKRGDRILVSVKSLEDDFGSKTVTCSGLIKL